MRLRVWSLALLSVLRIQHCHELWCRLQMQLGSHIAVALATALIRPLAWEPPNAVEAALEKAKKQKNKQTNKKNRPCRDTHCDLQCHRFSLGNSLFNKFCFPKIQYMYGEKQTFLFII